MAQRSCCTVDRYHGHFGIVVELSEVLVVARSRHIKVWFANRQQLIDAARLIFAKDQVGVLGSLVGVARAMLRADRVVQSV